MNIPNTLTVNETQYTLVRLLGKGKGGYSYLVTDGAQQYVLKQIHHEPCNYYAFGDKLQAELRDYETLRHLGIPLPELLAVDAPRERLLKTYLPGPTAAELLKAGRLDPDWLAQVRAMCRLLYPAGLNIDYYPTNFVPYGGVYITSTTNAIPTRRSGTSSIGACSTGRCQSRSSHLPQRSPIRSRGAAILAAPQFFCRSLPNSSHKTRIICYNGIQKIFPLWEQSPARRRLSNIPCARPPAFSRGRGGKKQKL